MFKLNYQRIMLRHLVFPEMMTFANHPKVYFLAQELRLREAMISGFSGVDFS